MSLIVSIPNRDFMNLKHGGFAAGICSEAWVSIPNRDFMNLKHDFDISDDISRKVSIPNRDFMNLKQQLHHSLHQQSMFQSLIGIL